MLDVCEGCMTCGGARSDDRREVSTGDDEYIKRHQARPTRSVRLRRCDVVVGSRARHVRPRRAHSLTPRVATTAIRISALSSAVDTSRAADRRSICHASMKTKLSTKRARATAMSRGLIITLACVRDRLQIVPTRMLLWLKIVNTMRNNRACEQ